MLSWKSLPGKVKVYSGKFFVCFFLIFALGQTLNPLKTNSLLLILKKFFPPLSCITMEDTKDLFPGMEMTWLEGPIAVPVGEGVLGKLFCFIIF